MHSEWNASNGQGSSVRGEVKQALTRLCDGNRTENENNAERKEFQKECAVYSERGIGNSDGRKWDQLYADITLFSIIAHVYYLQIFRSYNDYIHFPNETLAHQSKKIYILTYPEIWTYFYQTYDKCP